MRSVEFLAWCRFGRGDSAETCVFVELTEEEAQSLEAQDKDVPFAQCEGVKDIYEKAYAQAVQQITEELREMDELGTAYLEEGQTADEVYQIGVEWKTE